MPQEDVDIEDFFLTLYKACVENLNISLYELDNTSFETLIEYVFYEPKNSNTMKIGGKTYVRVARNKVPSWL